MWDNNNIAREFGGNQCYRPPPIKQPAVPPRNGGKRKIVYSSLCYQWPRKCGKTVKVYSSTKNEINNKKNCVNKTSE